MKYAHEIKPPVKLYQVHGRTWGRYPELSSNSFFTAEAAEREKKSLDKQGYGDASGECRIDEFSFIRTEGEGQNMRHIYADAFSKKAVKMIYGV